MKLRIGHVVAAGFLIIAVVVMAVAVSNSRRPSVPGSTDMSQITDKPIKPAPKGRLDVEGLRLRDFDENGDLNWQIKSKGSFEFDQDTMLATGSDIEWELTRADGQLLSLKAPKFSADYKGETIGFAEGVVARSSEQGLSFQCSDVTYDLAAEQLKAAGPLTAGFQDYHLKAGDLSFKRTDSIVKLGGKVELMYLDYTLSATKAEVDTKTNRAKLTDGTRFKRGQYTGRADSISVDGNARQVSLQGDVNLKGDKVSASAPRAKLAQQAQRAQLSGGVKLTGKGFTASGPELTVDGAKSTATLSGPVTCKLTFGG